MPLKPVRENPDHETLARIAREDPVAFEALRLEMLDELIDRAPEHVQRRLKGLQFRIDQVRQLAHTPLGAAVRISDLMWKSFLMLNRELSGIDDHKNRQEPAKEARVIDFRPRCLPGAH